MKLGSRFWFSVLFIALIAVACNTSKNDIIPEPEAAYFVQFSIADDTIRFEDGIGNYGNGVGIATYEDSIGRLHSEYTTYIRSALHPEYEKNILAIQMVKFYTDTSWPSYAERFGQFNVGSYDYGSYNEDSTTAGIDGVVILYTDSSGNPWSSDLLYGQQQQWSTFQISSHQPSGNEQFGAKTEGTFNCRVFDGNGNHLDLTNGTFKARTIYPE
ncbi:MAG: hypothetical protein EP314_04710 [Bacteroidetes bacterium]|nr:MAG: hypothetical protein EP314_04710 [Bacteroidota bacterium]